MPSGKPLREIWMPSLEVRRIAVPHRLRGLVGVRCGQLAAPNKCTSKLWLLAQSDTLHTKRRMTMSATPAVSVMARKLRFFAAADYRCTLHARRWLSAQHAPRGLLFGKRSRRRLAHRVCRLLAVARTGSVVDSLGSTRPAVSPSCINHQSRRLSTEDEPKTEPKKAAVPAPPAQPPYAELSSAACIPVRPYKPAPPVSARRARTPCA